MKKKSLILGLSFLLTICVTACGEQKLTEVNRPEEVQSQEITAEMTDEENIETTESKEAEEKAVPTPTAIPTPIVETVSVTKEATEKDEAKKDTAAKTEENKKDKTSAASDKNNTVPEKTESQDAPAPEAVSQDPVSEAPVQEPVKSGVPTKEEILGKIFTQSLSATFVGKENGETFSDAADLADVVMSADVMAGYNEATGSVTLSETSEGMVMNMVLTFAYDPSGRIVYSGPVNMDATDFTATGTVSGYMK